MLIKKLKSKINTMEEKSSLRNRNVKPVKLLSQLGLSIVLFVTNVWLRLTIIVLGLIIVYHKIP